MKVDGVYKFKDIYRCGKVELPKSIQQILESLEYDKVFVEVEHVYTHFKRYKIVIDIPEDSLMENLTELRKYVPEVKIYFTPVLSLVFEMLSI